MSEVLQLIVSKLILRSRSPIELECLEVLLKKQIIS